MNPRSSSVLLDYSESVASSDSFISLPCYALGNCKPLDLKVSLECDGPHIDENVVSTSVHEMRMPVVEKDLDSTRTIAHSNAKNSSIIKPPSVSEQRTTNAESYFDMKDESSKLCSSVKWRDGSSQGGCGLTTVGLEGNHLNGGQRTERQQKQENKRNSDKCNSFIEIRQQAFNTARPQSYESLISRQPIAIELHRSDNDLTAKCYSSQNPHSIQSVPIASSDIVEKNLVSKNLLLFENASNADCKHAAKLMDSDDMNIRSLKEFGGVAMRKAQYEQLNDRKRLNYNETFLQNGNETSTAPSSKRLYQRRWTQSCGPLTCLDQVPPLVSLPIYFRLDKSPNIETTSECNNQKVLSEVLLNSDTIVSSEDGDSVPPVSSTEETKRPAQNEDLFAASPQQCPTKAGIITGHFYVDLILHVFVI